MSWSEEYRSKRMSAAQALEAVHSGDRVWIQSGCGTPSVLWMRWWRALPKCAMWRSST